MTGARLIVELISDFLFHELGQFGLHRDGDLLPA
jgi:hypothetical protein